MTPYSVRELRRILTGHPGDTAVRLSVSDGRRATVHALRDRVDARTIASEEWQGVG
ncbi:MULTISPECIES: hypothetical protein [unclassified Streptomyces]|uniref:hypothetical protein n=1 Tax=Streptomyces sp. ST1015 TaxID=1848900 RepID=UPI0019611E6C|nr:hypothetical protein [Streptomyces sp. ST1020]